MHAYVHAYIQAHIHIYIRPSMQAYHTVHCITSMCTYFRICCGLWVPKVVRAKARRVGFGFSNSLKPKSLNPLHPHPLKPKPDKP